MHDQGNHAVGSRLLVFDLFGGKGDRRKGCHKDFAGGEFLVNPQTGKPIAHIAPELHFAQLMSTEDGTELYGVDLASAGWTSVALVRLNATAGKILVKQNLSSDVVHPFGEHSRRAAATWSGGSECVEMILTRILHRKFTPAPLIRACVSTRLRLRTMCIKELQQKCDTDADENARPNPMCVDLDHAHSRKQEHHSADQK